MAAVFAHSAALAHVPGLDRALACSDCDLRALRVPVETRNRVRGKLAEFENFVVIRVPKIKRGIECN